MEERKEKRFILTQEGKEALLNILANKPYAEVYTIVNAISQKDIFVESEGNEIINFIGRYPYKDVISFFSKIESYFPEHVEDIEESKEEQLDVLEERGDE